MKNRCSGVKPSIFFALRRVFGQRALQRLVSDADPAEIRDVFAQCQLAVHVQARQRLERVVLRPPPFARALRMLWHLALVHQSFRFPFGVVLPALVVVAMRDFVPDHHADARHNSRHHPSSRQKTAAAKCRPEKQFRSAAD